MRSAALVCVMVSVASAAVEDDLRDADHYFELGEWTKASAAYDRVIAEAPGQVPAEAYGKRAAIFIIVKDFKGGLAFVAKAKVRLKDAPEILEQEALMLWETERKDDAIAVAEKVVAARPQAFSNQRILGEYYASRDPAKAATAYEAYLASRPADLEGSDVLPRVRLGFADLALAKLALADGDDAKAQQRYGAAADQFEIVDKKHGKKPNAHVNAENGLCAAYTGLEKWDLAIPRCEAIAADPKRVDPNKSVYYNLATAYLARKQPKKARGVAQEFTKQRPNEARGFILVGDTYFAERDWQHALDAYLEADKLLVPAQKRDKVQLSIRLGKTYRRLPDDGKNVQRAIDQLEPAQSANPTNLEVAIELGDAYLAGNQAAKATTLAEKMLAQSKDDDPGKSLARGQLLVIAGKGRFAQHQLIEARAHFEAAHQLRPTDVALRRDLVFVIDEQAFDAGAVKGKALLDEALAIDPESAPTLTDLAVLAIERGDCDGALPVLGKLGKAPGADPVVALRLTAKAYTCASKPDTKKAIESYLAAEKEADKANARLLVAEIDTELAPLVWDGDLDGAVAMLERAVMVAGDDPDVGPAAKRNLALALYRKGWVAMGANQPSAAVSAFERAGHDPSLLHGAEPAAFDFSYALALLDAGKPDQAAKLFKGLAARGNQASYLKAPFAKLGGQLFAAYAAYRSGTIATRTQATADLAKMRPDAGTFAQKLDELVAATWEEIAVEDWRNGAAKQAAAALANADKTAAGAMKQRIALDRAALALDKSKLPLLEGMNGTPVEALVDAGIVYDQLGRPRDAYDAWVKARARGANAPNLTKWIDAKKRMYGYP